MSKNIESAPAWEQLIGLSWTILDGITSTSGLKLFFGKDEKELWENYFFLSEKLWCSIVIVKIANNGNIIKG